MSAVLEARHLIGEVAGPMRAGAQVQEMLSAVARKTGLGVRRLRGIWNNEARAIRAEELDALREAAKSRREEQEAESRVEIQQIVLRLKFLEQRMAEIDPNFARSTVLASVGSDGGMVGLARPVAGRRHR